MGDIKTIKYQQAQKMLFQIEILENFKSLETFSFQIIGNYYTCAENV